MKQLLDGFWRQIQQHRLEHHHQFCDATHHLSLEPKNRLRGNVAFEDGRQQ